MSNSIDKLNQELDPPLTYGESFLDYQEKFKSYAQENFPQDYVEDALAFRSKNDAELCSRMLIDAGFDNIVKPMKGTQKFKGFDIFIIEPKFNFKK